MHNWFGIQNSNSRAKTILLIKPGGKRAAFIPKSICTKANATSLVWIWTRHVNPTFRVANYCTTSTTIWDDKDSSLIFLFIQFIWNNSHQLSFFQWSFKNKKNEKRRKHLHRPEIHGACTKRVKRCLKVISGHLSRIHANPFSLIIY